MFIKKMLKLGEEEALYVFVSKSFQPPLDSRIKDLYAVSLLKSLLEASDVDLTPHFCLEFWNSRLSSNILLPRGSVWMKNIASLATFAHNIIN